LYGKKRVALSTVAYTMEGQNSRNQQGPSRRRRGSGLKRRSRPGGGGTEGPKEASPLSHPSMPPTRSSSWSLHRVPQSAYALVRPSIMGERPSAASALEPSTDALMVSSMRAGYDSDVLGGQICVMKCSVPLPFYGIIDRYLYYQMAMEKEGGEQWSARRR
jgi:hypothetical protein